jgi:hypothetical protein
MTDAGEKPIGSACVVDFVRERAKEDPGARPSQGGLLPRIGDLQKLVVAILGRYCIECLMAHSSTQDH